MALRKDWIFRRGDLYIVNLNPLNRPGQSAIQPMMALQNNDGIFDVLTLIVAPLTIREKKGSMSTGYLVDHAKRFDHQFSVELNHVIKIDKQRVIRYIGKVSQDDMEGIDKALGEKQNLYIPISIEAP